MVHGRSNSEAVFPAIRFASEQMDQFVKDTLACLLDRHRAALQEEGSAHVAASGEVHHS